MALTMRQQIANSESRVLEIMKNIASRPDQDDPFYVLELKDVIFKVQQFRSLLPRVEIFYAVKCNHHEAVLNTLVSLGTNFDCATKKEIQKILSLGVSPSRIIYAHPHKSKSDLKFASEAQVSLMTFDGKEELTKISEIYPKAELVLRISFDAIDCLYAFGLKFGAFLEDSTSLLSLAHELGLRVVGVAFHVGTGCKEIGVYKHAIAAAREIFDEGNDFGMDMNVLDIGGGFPGRRNDGFENFASVINEALDTYFPEYAYPSLRVISEPGRYIVTSAFTLATRIISNRRVQCDNQAINMYYVNAGLYNAFWVRLEDSMPLSTGVLLCKENDDEKSIEKKDETSIIWGPTCAAVDVLNKNIKLPRLQCDDWLYWPDMGAYTLTLSTKFNGYPIPEVYVR